MVGCLTWHCSLPVAGEEVSSRNCVTGKLPAAGKTLQGPQLLMLVMDAAMPLKCALLKAASLAQPVMLPSAAARQRGCVCYTSKANLLAWLICCSESAACAGRCCR